jgi:hypothetical protein
MVRMNLQFHADSGELIGELLPRWLSDVDYFYAVRRLDGSIVDRRGLHGPVAFVGDRAEVADIFISLRPFIAAGETDLKFMRSNPGFLVASVSHVTDRCLRESHLGSLAVEQDSVAAWLTVLRKAKRELLKGAVIVGVDGERRIDAHHRYTPRAAELWRQGIRMLSVAGSVAYDFDDAS